MAEEKVTPAITGAGGSKSFLLVGSKTVYPLYTPSADEVLRVTIVSQPFDAGAWNLAYVDVSGAAMNVDLAESGSSAQFSNSFVIQCGKGKPLQLQLFPADGKKMNVSAVVESLYVAQAAAPTKATSGAPPAPPAPIVK
jgi:hypothetical protein